MSSRSVAFVTALIVLLLLPLEGAIALTNPREVPYPPLNTPPSDLVSDGRGNLWFALPQENALGQYNTETRGLRLVRVGFATLNVAYSDNSILTYSRLLNRAAIIDTDTFDVRELSLGNFRIEGAEPSDSGFCVVGMDGRGTVVMFVDRTGTVRGSLRADLYVQQRNGIGCIDGFVWGIGTNRDRLVRYSIDGREFIELRVGVVITGISALSGEDVWVATSDNKILLYGPRGLKTSTELHNNANFAPLLFATSDRRIYHVDLAGGYVTEVDSGTKVVKHLGVLRPDLVAMYSSKSIYVLSVNERKLVLLYTSRPPRIEDPRVNVVNATLIRVEARVVDPDRDLAVGYPQVVLIDEGFRERVAVMRSIGGDRYSSEVRVTGLSGRVTVMVRAADIYDNYQEITVGRYELGGDAVRRIEEENAPQNPSTTGLDGSLGLFLIEFALLLSLLAALAAFAIRRRSRRKGRGRLRR
ncbi:MAG: hypothetical protein NZ920_01880 [Aigarchaeota archaeon]|nr:hypothetical protein [Aigarchaeota archaeon]MDW8093193.1 hypothetical protein [Nitrososphaerota archaeon]